jgi:molybdenum cofactor biosynthesis enzyme MoaA
VDQPLATAEDFGRIFRDLSPPSVQISGGEPMLREDVLDIIAAMQQPNGAPYTIMVSNGSLLTPEAFRQLNETGVDAYSISLDYPDDRHDVFRTLPGLFGHLKDFIAALTPEERCKITLNCVVQSDNFREALPLANLARDWGVKVNYSPYTWLRTDDKDYVVPKEHLPELREIYRELLVFQAQHGVVNSSATFLNNIVSFFESTGMPNCQAGKRFLVVNPDGTLSPCGLIITDYPDQAALVEGFSDGNDCTMCNTSIRAWTERPFATLFSSIRKSA